VSAAGGREGLLGRGWRGGWWSAGRGGERLELLERGLQRLGPRPDRGEVQLALACGEREPGADVQEPVAQPFRFGFGELTVEAECLGPDEQVVREHHDVDPHLVERECLERELLKARVFVVADPVLDPGALAVTTLDDPMSPSVWSVRIAWKRYPSWSVNDSCAPGCGRSRRTITLDPSGQDERSSRWVISTTSPFSRSDPP
jgi:hypothetical protein